jgi:hypothetical protein
LRKCDFLTGKVRYWPDPDPDPEKKIRIHNTVYEKREGPDPEPELDPFL